jgi:hypothetical protein
MKRKMKTHITPLITFLIILMACTKETSITNSSDSEGLPFAIIRNDAVITSESKPNVTMDGSLSYDPYGFSLTYEWKIINGPSDPLISGATEQVARLSNLIKGTYSVQLTISNKSGKKARDTGYIHVIENIAPIANAGKDLRVFFPDESVTLNGANSHDPYDSIIKFEWKQIDGPSNSNIKDPNGKVTVVNNLKNGKYSFELSVFDAMNSVGKDTVDVYVVSPVIGNNEVYFYSQPAIADAWGYSVTIPNIHMYVPQVDSIKSVHIRKSGTTNWTELSNDPFSQLGYSIFVNDLFFYIDDAIFGQRVDVMIKW